MSSTKGLSHLEVDYSDGYDVDGVQISGRVLKIICARIPPAEFTHERVLNDCLSFGMPRLIWELRLGGLDSYDYL